MRIHILSLSILLALAVICGCTEQASPNGQPDAPATPTGSAETAALVTANNRFGFELLRKVDTGAGNTAVSPVSVAMALQMAAAGADGDTLLEMRQTMRLGDLAIEPTNAALLAEMAQRKDVRLELANSLWADPGRVEIKPDFVKTVEDSFRGVARERSFGDSATRDEINDWVSQRTSGKIPKLLEGIPAETVAYLINAVYFKGVWSVPFDAGLTRQDAFHAPGGDIQVAMMQRKGDFAAFDDNGVSIARLTMGEAAGASMWFAMPAEGASMATLLEGLGADVATRWQNLPAAHAEILRLPKFKLDSRHDLKPPLASMGIRRAFGGQADFGRIGDDLFISEVIHQVVVEIDETGAEAAAATAVGLGVKSIPRELVFDRPFFFMITDDVGGSVLFAGVVYTP